MNAVVSTIEKLMFCVRMILWTSSRLPKLGTELLTHSYPQRYTFKFSRIK